MKKMKAVVVYDSYFGNTEKIALVIGDVLRERLDVEVLKVGDASPQQLSGLDLLVVGTPTRKFSPSPGTSELVKNIPGNSLVGTRVAVFDTRIPKDEIEKNALLKFLVGIFGYAAEPVAKRLKRKGGTLAAPAEGFYVQGTEGPLSPGEAERAAEWARHLPLTA